MTSTVDLLKKANKYFIQNNFKSSFIDLCNHLELQNNFDPYVKSLLDGQTYISQWNDKLIYNDEANDLYKTLTGESASEYYEDIRIALEDNPSINKITTSVEKFCEQISYQYYLDIQVDNLIIEKNKNKLWSISTNPLFKYLINSSIIIGILNIIVLFLFLWTDDRLFNSNGIDYALLADIGTYLAGTTGTLWGLAGILLILNTYRQSQVQQFENSYFNMLSIMNTIIENVSNPEGLDYFSKILDEIKSCIDFDLSSNKKLGYKRHKKIVSDFFILPKQNGFYFKKEYVVFFYESIYKQNQARLGHLFRYIFNLIKIVDSNEFLSEKEKQKYINLIQAQLSSDVLGLIFYNALSSNSLTKKGNKFKNYITKYNFLENIDVKSIVQYEDIYAYRECVFKFDED